MKTIMTAAEIKKKFASEWVLVQDPRLNDSMEVQAGTVLFHSKDRDEVYRKAIELRPKRFAMLFTGTPSKDAPIVLSLDFRRLGVSWSRAGRAQDPRVQVLLLQLGEPRAGTHSRRARGALREVLAGARGSRGLPRLSRA